MANLDLKYLFLIVLITTSLSCRDDDDGGMDDPHYIDLTTQIYNPSSYDLVIPDGFPQMEIPEDNPLTAEGVELGRFLFFDPILSADSTMSCAHCHAPTSSFSDNVPVSTGIDGIAGTRNSMSLVNVGFNYKGLFWDGRVSTLEEQALLPVEDPIELHNTWPEVEEKLATSSIYPVMFRAAFGIENNYEITKELTAKALAQFERTLISGNSRFDQIKYQNLDFFGDDELLGWDMFFDSPTAIKDAECAHCHNAPLFTDNEYFNNGIDSVVNLDEFPDLGLGAVTNFYYDNGTFRAPTLRNIELTAPYMHDGRFETLEEVIEHYNSGGHIAENLGGDIRPLGLTDQEKGHLLTFLKTLTDTSFVNNPKFSSPFE